MKVLVRKIKIVIKELLAHFFLQKKGPILKISTVQPQLYKTHANKLGNYRK
jgi:hypothetical protein